MERAGLGDMCMCVCVCVSVYVCVCVCVCVKMFPFYAFYYLLFIPVCLASFL